MADSRVPCNPLESFKVPDDVKIRLAELELELSEGKYHNYCHTFLFQTFGGQCFQLTGALELFSLFAEGNTSVIHQAH